jgi:hypothetical protein
LRPRAPSVNGLQRRAQFFEAARVFTGHEARQRRARAREPDGNLPVDRDVAMRDDMDALTAMQRTLRAVAFRPTSMARV